MVRMLNPVGLLCVLPTLCGCAVYDGMARLQLSSALLADDLSDVLAARSLDAKIETEFPAVLAVAKIQTSRRGYYGVKHDVRRVEMVGGEDDEAWRKLNGLKDVAGRKLIDDVRFINPMLLGKEVNLGTLRQAAAVTRAPLLLIYVTDETGSTGLNEAAILYWTIAGIWFVPGHTVGHYAVGQALLIDTRTGLVLNTAHGDSLKEEDALYGALAIVERRTRRESRHEAIENLVQDVRQALLESAAESRRTAGEIRASQGT